MHVNESVALCVVPDSPARRHLSGAEAAVIVVVIIVAAALTTGGMPSRKALSLLGAAGLMSVAVTRLATGAVTRVLRHLARTQSASLPR
ncbi:hypothetical protein QF035_002404 [Streptomyces umbrinus]|uniref:Uncharacterized protein n=1 Tax=Streptomyces umbrinus TaxID=67370 RepID=A0ABU0SMX5_9ACTN|nr:hypothetical protein [Streptomyces umbrinus]MDQ1024822.1 hypothetical protein [Streptomyces umbrinus]